MISSVVRYLKWMLSIVLFCSFVILFYIKHEQYVVNKQIIKLDKEILSLKKYRDLLKIELTIMSSADRLILLVDKNEYLLKEKGILTAKQIQTKENFTEMAKVKAIEKSAVAKNVDNKTI